MLKIPPQQPEARPRRRVPRGGGPTPFISGAAAWGVSGSWRESAGNEYGMTPEKKKKKKTSSMWIPFKELQLIPDQQVMDPHQPFIGGVPGFREHTGVGESEAKIL